MSTIELHGYLRALVCVNCHNELDRAVFQERLSQLNPTWAAFLAEMLETGALTTENPDERKKRGLKSNPDGDVDVPGAPYTTFRYPACPTCLFKPPILVDGTIGRVEIDADGAWSPESNAGILKPAVIMFGESIKSQVKQAAEQAVSDASRILVIGSSLATYSAWRLVKQARDEGMPIGVLNLGGVRGEDKFFDGLPSSNQGALGMRCSESADKILPTLVETLQGSVSRDAQTSNNAQPSLSFGRME